MLKKPNSIDSHECQEWFRKTPIFVYIFIFLFYTVFSRRTFHDPSWIDLNTMLTIMADPTQMDKEKTRFWKKKLIINNKNENL